MDEAIKSDLDIVLSEFEKSNGKLEFREDLLQFMLEYLQHINEFQRKRLENQDTAIKEFRVIYIAAKEAEEELPHMPRYLGKCFLDIAEHLSMRPNFSNYM